MYTKICDVIVCTSIQKLKIKVLQPNSSIEKGLSLIYEPGEW